MSAAATALLPATPAELADAIRATPKVVAMGGGTKPRLSSVGPDYARIATTRLRGIVEYEPSEFTFTALAGTPLKDIVAALAERGQYLPFDPMLASGGATLGGAIAAGLSGPGRFRFGGLRDFILGVQFVDGAGRLLRMGGKVVKNAAGFDLPKFFVGSLGRYGVLAEATFKVFPRPVATRTVRLEAKSPEAKGDLMCQAGSGRWEIDALDAPLEEPAVYVRIGGPAEALDALAGDLMARWPGETMTSGDGAYLWQSVAGFSWAHSAGTLLKVAITPAQVAAFIQVIRAENGARAWVSVGGNVGYVSLPPGAALPALRWPAMTLRGDAPLWPGSRPRFEIMAAVKQALDPEGRFPPLDD